MARYRDHLPQLSGGLFITDGGLETDLCFKGGFDLPENAAFVLLKEESGRRRLHEWFSAFASLARRHGVGLVLDTPTWRASRSWANRIGYPLTEVVSANRQAVDLLARIRNEAEAGETRIVLSGCLGPRGDGYVPTDLMEPDEARDYHWEQIQTFVETEADMVSALTLNYPAEAVGITRAASSLAMPVAISFTVETDGRLPSGHSLREAIEIIDAATDSFPAYYMINCAHPRHFSEALLTGRGEWLKRLRGLRANASSKSHAELDACTELDEGDPQDLAASYRSLRRHLPHLSVMGGCCGTSLPHVEAIRVALTGSA